MATRGRPTVGVTISPSERTTLEQCARRRTTAQGLAQRAQIVSACAAGQSNSAIATALRITRQTAARWRHRFVAKRLDGLVDEPRPGTPRRLSDAQVEHVITETLERKPRDATQWSTRALAKELELSHATVGRIWRAFGLQPHRARRSNSRATRSSSTKCATSSASIWRHPIARREESNPGARPDRARPADDLRLARASDPRLPAAWHDIAVRGARCRDRQGDRRVPSTPSESGVPQVSRDH